MSAFSLIQVTKHLRRASPCGFSAAEIECVKQLVGHSIAEVERELIRETLAHYCGNRTQTAHILNISIRALRNKIREYKACGTSVPEPSRHH